MELSQTITALLGPIRTAEGCLRCDFFNSMEDEQLLCLLEEWDSRKNLEKHMESKFFQVLRGSMHLLEKPCEIISFRSLQLTGIEEICHPVMNELKEPYHYKE